MGVSRTDIVTLGRSMEELAALVAEQAEAVRRSGGDQRSLQAALERLQHASSRIGGQLEGLDRGVQGIEQHQARLELHARVLPTMTWVEWAQVPNTTVVSIVLPTRDRCGLLRDAVDSVLAQGYPRWELIVVDDGSTDDTPKWLAGLTDERITTARTEGVGVAAARNRGLELARGDVVCYLDDDNRLHPLWVKSLAWAFSRWTALEVAYGARVVEDPDELASPEVAALIHLEPFDRSRLEVGNFIDVGVLAHRGGLPGVRFDEALSALADWDLVLRLTRDRVAVPLPVIAVLYSTSAPDRLTDRPEKVAELELLRKRIRDASEDEATRS